MAVTGIGSLPGIGGIGGIGAGSVDGVGQAGSSLLDRINQIYQRQAADVGSTSADTRVSEAAAGRGADFARMIANGIGSLESLDRTAAERGVQAATGDLNDVHDYVIAATEMQTATEITTTLRNKALEAFNDIMRMPL
ncbi:MAG: flagellar hook-basal body complex protein FliE [Kineosporiaceae bacterium]|nr:flagellar hook-basal body complex protein FliE [Kineosporiaceae bacterium]